MARVPPFLCLAFGMAGLLLGGSGCHGRLDLYRYDNPRVRSLQATETEAAFPEHVDRERLKEQVSLRTGFLVSGLSDKEPEALQMIHARSAGRAAAISADGYYLTAHHVVENQPFALIELEISPDLKPGLVPVRDVDRFVTETVYHGRVVWEDPQFDLAIVKFEVTDRPHFQLTPTKVSPGAFVYSAHQAGITWQMNPEHSWEDRIGNGAFEAAGQVLSLQPFSLAREARLIVTSIVGRGGMSGAPVVDENGELVGVFSAMRANYLFPSRARALVLMLSPSSIQRILNSDREKAEAFAPHSPI